MDRGFIVALLSASRLLVWRRCQVDACSLRNLFTGKMLAATNKGNLHARDCIDEYSLEIAGGVGDTPTCQSLGIPSIGLDELRVTTSPLGKVDMRYMTDVVGAGHFLMLRF